MRLRYAGTCRACGLGLDAGTRAVYGGSTKSVQGLSCGTARGGAIAATDVIDTPEPVERVAVEHEPVDGGVAGASARREGERRSAKRESRIRDAHPHLGGLILALSDDP